VRVCLLVPELGRSGGAQTIRALARDLERSEDFEVDVRVTDPRAPEHSGPALAEAAYDVAVATWWETVGDLWRVPAARRAVLLQSIESRFYEERHFVERLAAEEVLALPLAYLPIGRWMLELVAELRPDAQRELVPVGIDKSVFAARERPPRSGPLRVLIDGQPSMWFKGVSEAVACVRAMEEPAEPTVVAGDPADAGDVHGARVVGGLDPAGMANLYAESDVLVKLSRVEGLGLGPVEAAHLGTPSVVAPYTGHDEHVAHGRNGLVVGFDDEPGTARALDRLAREPGLLARLSEGALASASDWPSAEDATAAFAAALRRVADAPAPDPDPALAALGRARRRRLELTREYVRQAGAQLEQAEGRGDWLANALDEARAMVEDLNASIRDLEELVAAKDQQIADIRSERAYRAAAAVRRIVRRRDR
jgi:glycosyltransferase involved in cell wall biosynthesis